MKRLHLNLTAGAWRTLRRAWHPAWSPMLLWQSFITGPVLSQAYAVQTQATSEARECANLKGALVVLGYWRSGTTLLHELLAASGQWACPTTHACMNPQTFALNAASIDPAASVRRPMDDMIVRADTPQEDDFALLGLGARTPYEALLFPDRFSEALRLADPSNLSPDEQGIWDNVFSNFVSTISGMQDAKPLLLKSPPHAYRIDTLRRILPDCRFVLIVRNPYAVFESSVRMWLKLMQCYALTHLPTEDVIRQIVLNHRPEFEARLQAGLRHLTSTEYTSVRFEDLIARPGPTIAGIYDSLGLDGGGAAVRATEQEMQRREYYAPRDASVPSPWREQIKECWADVFSCYDYFA